MNREGYIIFNESELLCIKAWALMAAEEYKGIVAGLEIEKSDDRLTTNEIRSYERLIQQFEEQTREAERTALFIEEHS